MSKGQKRTKAVPAAKDCRRQHQQLQAFYDSGLLQTVVLDKNGIITTVNKSFAERFGSTPEELTGKPIIELFPAEVSVDRKNVFFEVLETGKPVRNRDNREGNWNDYVVFPVLNDKGEIEEIGVVSVDITENILQAEKIREHEEEMQKLVDEKTEALVDSEARLKALSDATFEAIFLSDKGICIEQNKTAEKMFGYTLEEARGNQGTDWIAPEARDKVMQNMMKGVEEPYEAVALRKDGSKFPCEIQGRMLEYKGKQIRVTALRDITERKKLEGERINLERQILQTQKLESLGILAGGIAHDFNNILMAVLANADIALRSVDDPGKVKEKLNDIIRSSRRAAGLTNQMLAYSGRGVFEVEPVKINDIVREMAHMLEISISKKIDLVYDFDSNLPSFEADATQIRQVIMNLITNASEAIGDSAGSIHLRTKLGHYDQEYLDGLIAKLNLSGERGLKSGDYIVIEVEDDGCGIDRETMEKLFDPFFTTKFTGRGLGLAAVLGIVRAHGGVIDVDSKPGKGSAFIVMIPVVSSAPPVEEPEVIMTELDDLKGEGTILVADDEEAIASVAQEMLERMGYDVIVASDGEEAVELFDKFGDGVDCVLLDLTMPRLSGVEVFERIRAKRSDISVILMSGYSEIDVSSSFSGQENISFIQKPFPLDVLLRQIKEILESKLSN